MSCNCERRRRYALQGRLVSSLARDWLQRAESPSILSLYRAAANLGDETQGVLSLNLPEVGPGPFALVVQADDPEFDIAGGFAGWLKPDDHVRVDGSALIVGPLSVSLTNLDHWAAKPGWAGVRQERLPESVLELAVLLKDHAPQGSLAPLLDSEVHDQGKDADLATAVVQAARAPASGLLAGVVAHNKEQLADAAQRLAGLGGGVTPAGDDYLIGAMHALWTLLEPQEAARLSQVIAEHAQPRTNRIAGAWLLAAARGEAAQPWHALVAALSNRDLRNLAEPGLSLVQVGHTSGADALTGFIGMVQAIEKEKLRWSQRSRSA